MKKSALIAVLGLAVGVASSYGQGSIKFDSYSANNSAGIVTTFLAGGAKVGAGYTASLVYSLSPIVDSAGNSSLLPGWSFTGAGSVPASVNTSFLTGGAAGYFAGTQNFVLQGYTPGATVYFEILAYQTAAGSYANSLLNRGHSAVIATTLATGTTLPGFMSWTPFTVAPVPEPTTLALAGLGGLASLVMLRRKNA